MKSPATKPMTADSDQAGSEMALSQQSVPFATEAKTVEIHGGAYDSAVQKTVELPQVQHIERIIDVTVLMRHQVPSIHTVRKMLQVPQSQCFDRGRRARGDEATGMILQETRTAEISQMPFIDRIVSRVPACTSKESASGTGETSMSETTASGHSVKHCEQNSDLEARKFVADDTSRTELNEF